MQKHIIVVDDDSNTRLALAFVLRNCGYLVSLAATGEQAVNLICSSIVCGDKIDLAIVDIEMTGLSGSHLVDSLKDSAMHVPVFVVSGFRDKVFLINLLSRCSTACFEKAWPVKGAVSTAEWESYEEQ